MKTELYFINTKMGMGLRPVIKESFIINLIIVALIFLVSFIFLFY